MAKAPLPQLTQDFWNDPAFVKGFMGDYGFRSEVEPRIRQVRTIYFARSGGQSGKPDGKRFSILSLKLMIKPVPPSILPLARCTIKWDA